MNLELLAVFGLGVLFAHVLDHYLFVRHMRRHNAWVRRALSYGLPLPQVEED
jgi:hypothetical protein